MSGLCLLHGFTGTAASFAPVLERSKRPALVPALLGHAGASAAPEVTSFEQEVQRLAQLVERHAPFTLVGYSLGARLALGLALARPAWVSSLVLISGHPGLATHEERAERASADRRWQELLETQGIAAFVDAWQAQPLWASQARLPPALQERKRRERLSHEPHGLARSLALTGLGQMPSYRERLAEIRVPVALASGALDLKFCALADEMACSLPRAERLQVPDAGHDLLLERPDLITELLTKEPFQ
jgi:2-succinyl-6-hydroxy-2,4-cyclohexadiene-1-carboxylate synthase